MSEKLTAEARKRVLSIADPIRKAEVLRVIPTAKTNGAAVPAIRAQVVDFKKQQKLPFAAACDLCDALTRNGEREHILFAFFLVASYPRDCRSLDWARLAKWLEAVDNWETCDQLASNVAAEMAATDPQKGYARLKTFAKSKNIWERRFALSTSASLNQRGRYHPEITLPICQMLLADKEPMIQTSIAWALRELTRKDEEAAFAFLDENLEVMKPSTVREAAKKLPPELRKRLGL